jgi:hypothetical protein
MSDKNIPEVPPGVLTEDQVEAISGGICTAQQYADMLTQLKSSYETLIDFTTYVMERVSGK